MSYNGKPDRALSPGSLSEDERRDLIHVSAAPCTVTAITMMPAPVDLVFLAYRQPLRSVVLLHSPLIMGAQLRVLLKVYRSQATPRSYHEPTVMPVLSPITPLILGLYVPAIPRLPGGHHLELVRHLDPVNLAVL